MDRGFSCWEADSDHCRNRVVDQDDDVLFAINVVLDLLDLLGFERQDMSLSTPLIDSHATESTVCGEVCGVSRDLDRIAGADENNCVHDVILQLIGVADTHHSTRLFSEEQDLEDDILDMRQITEGDNLMERKPRVHIKLKVGEHNALIEEMGDKQTGYKRVAMITGFLAIALLGFNLWDTHYDFFDIPQAAHFAQLVTLLALLVTAIFFEDKSSYWYERIMELDDAFPEFLYPSEAHEQWGRKALDAGFIAWVKAHEGLEDVDERGRTDSIEGIS